jgi:hypothetical protein
MVVKSVSRNSSCGTDICIINQNNALFFFTLLHYHASTCFRPICSSSSGGWVYSVVNVGGPTESRLRSKTSSICHIIHLASWWGATNGPEACRGMVTQYSEKIVHHVGLLYKYISRCTVNQTYNLWCWLLWQCSCNVERTVLLHIAK